MAPERKLQSDQVEGDPTGTVKMFAGASAPTGYMVCDGSGLDTTTYASLFAVIGYTYGGAGATFNLPDLRGRMPVGVGTGAGLTPRALGDSSGGETKDIEHQHTTQDHTLSAGELASHKHGVDPASAASAFALDLGPTAGNGPDFSSVAISWPTTGINTGGSGGAHNHGNTGDAGSTTQDVMNPFLALNFIIKT